MSLSTADVARIARLARLRVTEADSRTIEAQLNGILGLIETMRAVDTTGVEPMSHPQDLSLRLRDDVVTESNQRELNQQSAPAVEDGLFLVPKVIE